MSEGADAAAGSAARSHRHPHEALVATGSVRAAKLIAENKVSLVAWSIIGLISGVVTSRLMQGGALGYARDVFLGILGALIGGTLFNAFWTVDATVLHLGSFVLASAGAVLLIGAYYLTKRPARPPGQA